MIKVKEKNGKQYIYQYDTGREVIITPEEGYMVDSIEYFNNTTDLAPIGIIREMDGVLLSEIPNSFLRSANTIRVYLVTHDAENRQTIEYKDITVIPRVKPADYVLEPDDVLTWYSLDERLKTLEEGGTGGGTTSITVDSALDKTSTNPIQNKAVAEAVEKLSNDKLEKTELPEAVNTAIAQAKKSGEFDGADGTTPHIGENGNWFIGESDTGVSASGGTTSITVDDKLNKESTNPIQNKTVAEAVDRLSEEIDDFFDGFEEIAIPEEGGTSSEGNTEISLESTMQYGKVDQAGRLDSTVTGYMHTDKIKLPDTKSFKFRCVNINGAIRYPDLRYVTAYDANGDVLPYNSQQNVVQGTTTSESPVVMDEIVDSVIITVANGHQYTEKTVILIEDEGHAASFSAIRTEKLSGFTTKFTLNDVRRGNHKSGVTDFTDPRSICTQGFVKPFVKSVKVISDVYRLAVVIFNDGLYVRTNSWFTNGLSYTFDHETYQYKLYISRVDGEYIYDFDGCRESIELTISTSDILYAYNELETKSDTERLRMRKILDSMMRRKYDISYANASAPLNLITYTGDNQIVHPKVLYFPSKFGKHKYWIAYNPYPFANGVYENPCIAYSDDGYEWTNIDGNPLDDPNGVGVNTDVHIVYNGTTNLLEVWWRYAAKEEGVDEYPEIIYRKTSADGLNWSEKEVVINNDSGDHMRYFSPCILHDGNKYKVWVVNSTDNTINYYEGTEATSLSKVRDITLSYQDSDITYRLWHIDVIEDGGKTVMVAMCKANTQLSQKQQIWSLFLTTSEDNINFETPKLVIIGNPYGWDKQIYRSSIVNVDGEYRIYYTAQDEKQRHGLGVCTSNKLSEFVGII